MDAFLDGDEPSGGGFDPMALLRTFWRRKMLFFVPFVLCLAMAAIAIKTMQPIYASSGQVLVKFEGLNSSLLTDPSRRLGRGRDIDAMAYREMKILLTGPAFMRRMVADLGLEDVVSERRAEAGATPLSEDRLAKLTLRKLERAMILRRDGARLFGLELRDPDPKLAHKMASYILEQFVQEYRNSQTASSNSTRQFLQSQLEVYRKNLAAAESGLNTYLSGLASESLLNNPINVTNLSDVQTNLATMKERYEGTDAREMAELGRGMRNLLGSVPATASYLADDIVKTTLLEMESVSQEMLLKPNSGNDSLELGNRLGQLRVRLNTRIEEMVSREYSNLGYLQRNQISHFIYFSLFRAGTLRTMNRLNDYIREFQDFTTRQPEQSTRIAELQEEVATARRLVTRIESELTRQTMNLEASQSEIGMQIRIRKQPELPLFPVEPDKLKLTLMGIILSVGIGIGLVMLAIFLDRSFNTVEQIERTLGVAVIGTLPVIQDEHFERKKKVRLLRWATIIAGIIAVGAVGFLVVYPRLS